MKISTAPQQGFTFLEILIAISIFVLLITIASVSYSSFSNDTNTRAASSDLHSSLVLARIEAIKRGGWVKVCGSNNGDACNSDFSEGWLVYHDKNNDGAYNDQDTFIKQASINPNKVSLTLTGAGGNTLNSVDFNYRGFALQTAEITATKGNFEQTIVLNRIGRIAAR